MILDKTIEVRINKGNKGYFSKKFIKKLQINEIINLNIKELSKGSHLKINVKCDICNLQKRIMYKQYVRGSKYGYYTCSSKCSKKKIIRTNNKKYNSDWGFTSEEIIEKINKSNLLNYGNICPMKTKEIQEKLSKVLKKKFENNIKSPKCDKIIRGYYLTIIEQKKWKEYSKNVRNMTRRNKKLLLKNWNGNDYYDNEYIKENFSLNHYHEHYPTIDHKISVFKGFINEFSIEDIADIRNLCFTKRKLNAIKQDKSIEDFLLYLKNLKKR